MVIMAIDHCHGTEVQAFPRATAGEFDQGSKVHGGIVAQGLQGRLCVAGSIRLRLAGSGPRGGLASAYRGGRLSPA